MKCHWKKRMVILASAFLFTLSAAAEPLPVQAAAKTAEEFREEAEARKLLPVETDAIENWPTGPKIGAQGAVLMDADSGAVLYGKNIHEHLYPASTTKLMTSLVAAEQCRDLNEQVEFSHDAVFTVGPGATSLGIDVGERLTMEQCLYGMLVHSANEVCNAVGEHIAGSMEAYADLMNEKAAELGCVDSHFVTLNGLHDDGHYTSPYDLALIARAFFSNELLAKISGVSRYYIPKTSFQPDDDVYCNSHDLMLPGRKYAYEGIIGGKTGYTDTSRQTFVACAERDGMRLICVIMKEESPDQFLDTKELLDWGFANFHKINVSETDTRYQIDAENFFHTDEDIFGNSEPILEMDPESCIILPNNASYSDTESTISYHTEGAQDVAEIIYTYHGAYVGSAMVTLAEEEPAYFDFSSPTVTSEPTDSTKPQKEDNVIFINVLKVALWVLGLAAAGILLLFLAAYLRRSLNQKKRQRRRRIKKQIPSFGKELGKGSSHHLSYYDYDYEPKLVHNVKRKKRRRR